MDYKLDKKEIEKDFENLLEVANNVGSNEDSVLSDEQVDKLVEMFDKYSDESQDFPSNNGVIYNENTDPSQNITEPVLVSSNPATGLVNTIPYNSEDLTEEDIDNLINLKDEELKNIELDYDEFVSTVNANYDGVTEEELKELFKVANRYRNNEDFSYYNALPKTIQKEIDKYINIDSFNHMQNFKAVKTARNAFAKELFDSIIANNYSTKAFKDISDFTTSGINAEKDKLDVSISDYNNKLRNEYEVEFIKKAEAIEANDESKEEDFETARKLREVSRMFKQAYTYEDFFEAFKNGKVKIKNIEVQKFKRTCQEFNRKYYNNTFKIRDVGTVIPVLDRNLEKEYDMDTIKKFIVAFINYTKFYKPSNIEEHVFMYYFIQNILALDIKVNDEFNNNLKENIYKFLDLIIERDLEKQKRFEENKNGNK